MIISMRPHATREEIQHVRERIEEFGYKVHSIEGEERVVIGVVGVSRQSMPRNNEWNSVSKSLRRRCALT